MRGNRRFVGKPVGWDDDKSGDYVPPEVPLRVWLLLILLVLVTVLIVLSLQGA
jgi:hypothetical protein